MPSDFMKVIYYFPLLLLFFSGAAMGQWAVYDEEVRNEVRKINEVTRMSNGHDSLSESFKSDLSASSSG